MSTPKFTPGPWVLCMRDGEFKARTIFPSSMLKNGRIAADEWDGWLAETGVNNPEFEANANLIAAAPDLLEALKNIHEWLGNLTDWEGAGDPDLDGIRAAIAKAEGGAA